MVTWSFSSCQAGFPCDAHRRAFTVTGCCFVPLLISCQSNDRELSILRRPVRPGWECLADNLPEALFRGPCEAFGREGSCLIVEAAASVLDGEFLRLACLPSSYSSDLAAHILSLFAHLVNRFFLVHESSGICLLDLSLGNVGLKGRLDDFDLDFESAVVFIDPEQFTVGTPTPECLQEHGCQLCDQFQRALHRFGHCCAAWKHLELFFQSLMAPVFHPGESGVLSMASARETWAQASSVLSIFVHDHSCSAQVLASWYAGSSLSGHLPSSSPPLPDSSEAVRILDAVLAGNDNNEGYLEAALKPVALPPACETSSASSACSSRVPGSQDASRGSPPPPVRTPSSVPLPRASSAASSTVSLRPTCSLGSWAPFASEDPFRWVMSECLSRVALIPQLAPDLASRVGHHGLSHDSEVDARSQLKVALEMDITHILLRCFYKSLLPIFSRIVISDPTKSPSRLTKSYLFFSTKSIAGRSVRFLVSRLGPLSECQVPEAWVREPVARDLILQEIRAMTDKYNYLLDEDVRLAPEAAAKRHKKKFSQSERFVWGLKDLIRGPEDAETVFRTVWVHYERMSVPVVRALIRAYQAEPQQPSAR